VANKVLSLLVDPGVLKRTDYVAWGKLPVGCRAGALVGLEGEAPENVVMTEAEQSCLSKFCAYF